MCDSLTMNTAYNFLKDYIPIRNAVKTREDGEFLVALNNSSEIYYLNGMARDIWELIDGTLNIGGLCSKILDEYNVGREVLEDDIVNFIRDLQWKKLIRIKTGGKLS